MQMTSENYIGSMGFGGTAKSRSIESDIIDLEKEVEAEYPSSLLEPNKLQNASRHFETSVLTTFEHDWALIPPTQSTENEWSLSRLYPSQRIGSAEAIAERVVNSLQSIPAVQRVRVYESLLGRLEEKVREHLNQRRQSSSAKEFTSEMIGERGKEGIENRYPTTLGVSDEQQETPLYERVSAEVWSELFQQWAADHRKLAYDVDDSREAIYEDRGE